jgi:glucokinase
MRQLLVDNSEQLTAELVSRAAELGDALAQEVLLEAAHHLGKAIGDALMLMNPERIILGGGVTKAGEAYWEEIRRTAYASVWPDISVDIVPAALGDDAPLWGGIVLAEALVANTSK